MQSTIISDMFFRTRSHIRPHVLIDDSGILLDARYASMIDKTLSCAKAAASGLFCIQAVDISESEGDCLKGMQPVSKMGK